MLPKSDLNPIHARGGGLKRPPIKKFANSLAFASKMGQLYQSQSFENRLETSSYLYTFLAALGKKNLANFPLHIFDFEFHQV
jgi:hypothetical protein